MRIAGLQREVGPEGTQLSAQVGDRRVELRYSGVKARILASGDPFVIVGLVPAMVHSQPIEVEDQIPVSPSLMDRLAVYQEIYSQWWPSVRPVEIRFRRELEVPRERLGVGAFFSGGVDSLYSVVMNQTRISHLVLCRGLDIHHDEISRWQEVVAHVTAFAKEQGKHLCLVDTNAKPLFQLKTPDNHGAILVSAALPLAFTELIVPASHSYRQLFPWGSHPLTDPLLSTDVTRVTHDGAVPRSEKLAALVRAGVSLDSLRVCNHEPVFNCGRCEKCVRTMVTLHLLNAHSRTLPLLRGNSLLSGFRIETASQCEFWCDNRQLAARQGRPDLVRVIDRLITGFQSRERLKRLDSRYSGGLLGRVLRAVRRV